MYAVKVRVSAYPKKLRHLFGVILLVVVAILVALGYQTNFLITSLLFFGLPSLYLIALKPSNFRKAMIGGALFGLLWGFSFDFIAEFNQAWSWSTGDTLLFPGLFFGVVSLDIMVWFFLWIFSVIAFYEYFIENDRSQKISSHIRISILFGMLTLVALIATFKSNPAFLHIPYTYTFLGLAAFGPFLYLVVRRPAVLPKLFETVPFFIFLYLSFELVALKLNLWDFPGQYIGMVSLFSFRFPFEEFFFWVVVSSAIAASYHELFVDDGK